MSKRLINYLCFLVIYKECSPRSVHFSLCGQSWRLPSNCAVVWYSSVLVSELTQLWFVFIPSMTANYDYQGGGWIGFRIDGFDLKKRSDCGFLRWIERMNSRILKTQWIVDQLWILARIPDCACLDVRILGPKRNLDHRSFLSLSRYVNGFIQIISFFERSSFQAQVWDCYWNCTAL